MTVHTLYGTPLSLYTGKARSYLIKNGLGYREVGPAVKRFGESVLPRAGMMTMPTIETSDGTVIRDGAAIVDHFESQTGHPGAPAGPRQNVISLLMDVIGMEGLLRPAMHYRWDFPEENLEFLRFHFSALTPAGRDPVAFGEKAMDRMRTAKKAFGVQEDAVPGIERRYLKLLGLLDEHFSQFPYLLGGRPCIGDYSLIAPFYGHLGRDPKPLSILQSQAIRVFRWVERMNRPEPDVGEFVRDGELLFEDAYLGSDEIPATLVAVLQQVAVDFVPETLAAGEFINGWLDAQSDLAPGTRLERGAGLATFEVEGESIAALAQPYRFYLLSRVQAAVEALSPEDRTAVERLLDECNLLPVLGARLSRSIERKDNLEVWA